VVQSAVGINDGELQQTIGINSRQQTGHSGS
jgi:hypothetical protein